MRMFINNKKAGSGAGIWPLVFFGLIILGALWYFDVLDLSKIKNRTEEVVQTTKESFNTFTPPTQSWCVPQEIPTDQIQESPETIRINGYNNVDGCCSKSYIGFDNCQNRTSEVMICYTSSLGGEVKWVSVNGVYKNPLYYSTFVDNVDKRQISGFSTNQCNNNVY